METFKTEIRVEEKDFFKVYVIYNIFKDDVGRYIAQNGIQGRIFNDKLKNDGESYYISLETKGITPEEVKSIYENTVASLNQGTLDSLRQQLLEESEKKKININVEELIKKYHVEEGMSLSRFMKFLTSKSFIRYDFHLMGEPNKRKLMNTLADFGFEARRIKGSELKELLKNTNQDYDISRIDDDDKEYLYAEKTKQTLLIQIAKGLQTHVSFTKAIGTALTGITFGFLVLFSHLKNAVVRAKAERFLAQKVKELAHSVREMIEEANEGQAVGILNESDLFTIFKLSGVSDDLANELSKVIKCINEGGDLEMLEKEFFSKLEKGIDLRVSPTPTITPTI
jgi:hypothetical protein